MAEFTPLVEDRRKVTMRLNVLQFAISAAFAALACGFWYFQVLDSVKYQELAENNHQRTIALRAPRGVMFDRDMKVLVENRSSFTISIIREHTKDLDRTIRVLSQVAGLDERYVHDLVNRHRREPTYQPIVVVEDASLAEVAAVLARRLDTELPEVRVDEVPTRRYPTNEMAAHLFGYVGEAGESQVSDGTLPAGAIVGQSGVEKVYNALLMGQDGARHVVVNSVGREIRTLDEIEPTEGKRLQLTLDYDIQKAIDDAFKAADEGNVANAGAAVVLDPRNGEVLGFTSRPSFDPNDFAAGIDRATWAALNSDELRPLNDRAIQGRYSPGSTFKMAVALAGLEEGIITPDFRVNCPGHANFYGREFHCWMDRRGGHGSVDLRRAIAESCDVYFYTVANMVGIDKINKWATALGLGMMSGIDLPNEVQGLVPSTEWKREKMHEKWYSGETISVGIGQGQVSVTPVSMAVYMATLANGGTRVTPHLLKAVDDGSGWKPVPAPPPQSKVDIDPDKLEAIRDGMWMVVNTPAGTGVTARVAGRDVAGKTGSSQVISIQGRAVAANKTARNLRDHGWFVFFAPKENPRIAGVVFLEHGIHGGNAARVAHQILDTFFAKEDHRPLPPPPTADSMHWDFKDADR